MCDEDRIAATLVRRPDVEFTENLIHDIESFFAQKYATTACHFHLIMPQENDQARVDFTVSRDKEFKRRYVGTAGYENGHLTLGRVVRLT
jgi:hypothetical protein